MLLGCMHVRNSDSELAFELKLRKVHELTMSWRQLQPVSSDSRPVPQCDFHRHNCNTHVLHQALMAQNKATKQSRTRKGKAIRTTLYLVISLMLK
eukprot:2620692-Amphidinium_carterae.1